MKKIGPDIEILLWYKLGQILFPLLVFIIIPLCILTILGGR